MKSKVALVTGAGRGIGLETARLFVENHIQTIIVDCDKNQLENAKGELDSDLVEMYCIDVTDEESVQELCADLLEKYGVIDILMGSDGTKGDALKCVSRSLGNFLTGERPKLGFMTMDGQEVFRFAVKQVPDSIDVLMKRNQVTKQDIKYYAKDV